MKLLKKILRIIAIILPCFCCLALPNNSFAKQYSIDSFMAHGVNGYRSRDGSILQIASNPVLYLDDTSSLDFKHDTYFYSDWAEHDGNCSFNSLHRNGYFVGQREVVFGGSFLPNAYEVLKDAPKQGQCRSFGPYGGSYQDLTLPLYNRFSAPIGYQLDTNALLPYNYDFSEWKFRSTKNTFTPDDLVSSSGFNYSRIQGFEFPLNTFADSEDLSADSSVKIRFGFVFDDSLLPAGHSDGFSSNFGQDGLIQVRFTTLDNSSLNKYYDCNFSDISDVVCEIPISESVPAWSYAFSLRVGWKTGVSAQQLFSVNMSGFSERFYITYNNDSTWGGSISADESGNNVNHSPLIDFNSETEQSLFDKLFGGFSRDIEYMNPFMPLFAWVSPDQHMCYQFEELPEFFDGFPYQMCKIYPPDVVNVLTPVFNWLSMLVPFAFFIHWLRMDTTYVHEVDRGGK